jgi:hypothetical protein
MVPFVAAPYIQGASIKRTVRPTPPLQGKVYDFGAVSPPFGRKHAPLQGGRPPSAPHPSVGEAPCRPGPHRGPIRGP